MSAPRRNHTRYGVRHAMNATRGSFCDRVGQPDPACDCQACVKYFARAKPVEPGY